jgi:DNA-binding winged helix-turn-helix (wHTH) protein
VISRDTLRAMVWGDDTVSPNTVEVHISSLRRKIEGFARGRERELIHTVRGSGYVLRTPGAAPHPRNEAQVAERQRLLEEREVAVARREAVLLATRVEQARRTAPAPATASPRDDGAL